MQLILYDNDDIKDAKELVNVKIQLRDLLNVSSLSSLKSSSSSSSSSFSSSLSSSSLSPSVSQSFSNLSVNNNKVDDVNDDETSVCSGSKILRVTSGKQGGEISFEGEGVFVFFGLFCCFCICV